MIIKLWTLTEKIIDENHIERRAAYLTHQDIS